MLWRDDRGAIIAFNMVHRSGSEGWMGPLAVRTEFQGAGTGKEVVTRGVEWLRSRNATVIGLETMPRTMDNIGFYSRLGFLPGRLTITATLDAAYADTPARVIGRLPPGARDDALAECRALVQGLLPGYDYSREINLTQELGLGDTVLLHDRDRIVGYALAHTAPLVEGRAREELRVLKLVLEDEARLDALVSAIADFARRSGTRRIALRLQGEFLDAYQRIIALGGHVRWTDLRMSYGGYEERRPERGLVLSNWEI
jgi:GNAT superfamily N-acetyltransferase